ncbi:MAG: penicillin-binding protein, partial [Firmicutes bacterium]|nr:penicillin-binding protein [Bacillota bacterium]
MDYSKQSNQRKRIERGFDHQRLVSKIWLNVLRVACISVLAAIFVVAGVLLGAFMGIIDDSPLKDDYTIQDFTSYIYDAEGNQMTPIYTSVMRSEVSINDIPQHVQQAVVAIEDSRFYQHNGIDIEGIIRSGVQIFQGGDLQGGSTITQQVIKNLALTSDTAMTRKIQEWYMALQYEYQLTTEMGQTAAKRKILETYLNFVNFGNGNYGVQSASRFYFNKNVDEISIAEAAVLAGVLNAPSYFDPVSEQKACRERQVTVLQAMRDQGFITEPQYESAVAENVFGLIRENTMGSEDDDSSTNYT